MPCSLIRVYVYHSTIYRGENETQRNWVICPKSHRRNEETRAQMKASASRPQVPRAYLLQSCPFPHCPTPPASDLLYLGYACLHPHLPLHTHPHTPQHTHLTSPLCPNLSYPSPVEGVAVRHNIFLPAVYLGNMFKSLFSGHSLGQWPSFLPMLWQFRAHLCF